MFTFYPLEEALSLGSQRLKPFGLRALWLLTAQRGWTGSPSLKELHLVSKRFAETGLGKAKGKGEEKTAQAGREE